MARWFAACVFFVSSAFRVGSLPAEPGAKGVDGQEKRQSAALKVMKERAEAATVSCEKEPDRPLKLVAEPLLHYSDREVNILNGGLWAWGDTGRPQAFLKTEAHLWNGDDPPRVTWVYCFVSTAGDRIDAAWPNGQRFQTSEPGLKLENIPDGPKPAEAKPARLAQMKELARRFSVRVGNAGADHKMRFLPTPVHRYADAQAGIQEGAVFAFAATGTNPGVVLLLELYQPKGAEPKWQYSLSRLGIGEVAVQLDERVVYEQAYTGIYPVKKPTWMWFFEKGMLPKEKEE